jgi:O-succinylbenzoic acid--CoA ligase
VPRQLTLVPADELSADHVRAALDGTSPLAVLPSGPPAAVAAARAVLAPDEPLEAGADLVVVTSGSTGNGRGVLLSADALTASATATHERLGGPGAWLLALPVSAIAGLQVLCRGLLAGERATVLERSDTLAAATARMPAGRRYTALVPTQLRRFLDAEPDGLRAFDAVLVGGAATDPELLARAHDAGVAAVTTYGMTETAGGCVYDGQPLDTIAVRSVDGELHIAGPVLADGYLGDPEMTDERFLRDDHGIRWYRTGDLGIVEDGIVRVHGRADNVIVSGGINVSLDRVEHIVRQVPGLGSAIVVGVDHDRWGEASVIVAVRGESLRRSEAEQLVHARDAVEAQIGAHARPDRLILVDELATLPSGKPDREAIRTIAAALR